MGRLLHNCLLVPQWPTAGVSNSAWDWRSPHGLYQAQDEGAAAMATTVVASPKAVRCVATGILQQQKRSSSSKPSLPQRATTFLVTH